MRRRPSLEVLVLGAMVLVFVAATAYFTSAGLDDRQRAQPTSYSAGPSGVKGLYELLDRQGLSVGRWERPIRELPADAVLIVMEPLARPMDQDGSKALRRWQAAGGRLLLFASGSLALPGVPVEGVAVESTGAATSEERPRGARGSVLSGVRTVRLEGRQRLTLAVNKRAGVLAADRYGALVVRGPGPGRTVVVADALSPRNGRLADADNAVLLANLASGLANGDRPIFFDEYHQGFGGEGGGGPSLWEAVGPATRAAFWYLLVGVLFVVYNANRRFGAPRRLETGRDRPVTEYIESMARLYRRAGARGIALEFLSSAFERDLAARVGVAPDARREEIARAAERLLGLPATEVAELLQRCDRAGTGAPLTDAETLRLAKDIYGYRRKADIARSAGP